MKVLFAYCFLTHLPLFPSKHIGIGTRSTVNFTVELSEVLSVVIVIVFFIIIIINIFFYTFDLFA